MSSDVERMAKDLGDFIQPGSDIQQASVPFYWKGLAVDASVDLSAMQRHLHVVQQLLRRRARPAEVERALEPLEDLRDRLLAQLIHATPAQRHRYARDWQWKRLPIFR